jgi:hypothetical protein
MVSGLEFLQKRCSIELENSFYVLHATERERSHSYLHAPGQDFVVYRRRRLG